LSAQDFKPTIRRLSAAPPEGGKNFGLYLLPATAVEDTEEKWEGEGGKELFLQFGQKKAQPSDFDPVFFATQKAQHLDRPVPPGGGNGGRRIRK